MVTLPARSLLVIVRPSSVVIVRLAIVAGSLTNRTLAFPPGTAAPGADVSSLPTRWV